MFYLRFVLKFSLQFLFVFIANIAHSGTCTGSSNCTACTTCNYCAHCNDGGGSCGVCGGGYDSEGGFGSGSNEKSSGNIFWGIVKWILIIGGVIVILSFLRK